MTYDEVVARCSDEYLAILHMDHEAVLDNYSRLVSEEKKIIRAIEAELERRGLVD